MSDSAAEGSQLKELQEKLDKLRRADTDLWQFGARSHEYRLIETLSDQVISALESRHGVRLPTAYRRFLTDVGEGGAGPGMGLMRLGWASLERLSREPAGENSPGAHEVGSDLDGQLVELALDLRSPGRPFPLEEAYLGVLGSQNPPINTQSLNDGSLILASYGGGIEARLVVEGTFSGHVWMRDRGAGMFTPFGLMAGIHRDGEAESFDDPIDFIGWYIDWLEGSLSH